jgi:hypothetical protein
MQNVAEIVLKAARTGEMTQADADMHLAVGLANNLGEYEVLVYPQLPISLESYVDGRATERIEYDAENSRRVGNFTHRIRELESKNYSAYEVICWAARLLWEKNYDDQALRCKAYAGRFKKFDRSLLSKLYEVQRLDAIVRSR